MYCTCLIFKFIAQNRMIDPKFLKCLLELGSSDPFIVCQGADMDKHQVVQSRNALSIVDGAALYKSGSR